MERILQTFSKQGGLFSVLSICLFFAFSANAQVMVTLDATNPTCGGFTNGSITANPSGGWAPYTFQWSNGATSQTISGLAAGTYSVTATDMDLGYAVATVTLTAPPQTDAEIVIDDICSGNGNVTIEATGGVAPYTYNWGDGYTAPTRTGLAVNTQYCVTVLDANFCGVVTCQTIPAPLNLDIVAQDVVCFQDCDGSVVANITGGTGPFNILWSNGFTSEINANLDPGTYTVTVTDANGCTEIGSGTVNDPDEIEVSINVTSAPCAENGSASASASAIGGTPTGGYTYTWSNGAVGPSVTGLYFGTYMVTATDMNGCTGVGTVEVTPSAQVVLSFTSTNPTCANTSGGSISVNATGGTEPYTYAWNNGGSTSTINGLAEGTYTVMVTDAGGCVTTESITLTQEGATIYASVTEQDATCGENNGSAVANGSNGSGSYSYAWSNGMTTQTINNLGAGDYTVTVTDNATGCTALKTITITNTSGVTATASNTSTVCAASNGSASVNVTSGTAPYTYSWSNGGTSQTIVGLSAGTYTVTVTDANSCTTTVTTTVNSSNTNIAVNASSMPVSCNGNNDGSVGLSVNGGAAPYTFSWNSGQQVAALNNLTAGTYTVTVTDANGCTAVASTTVNEPTSITSSINSTNAGCAGENNGSITLNVNGGTPGYSYDWSNGATIQNISGLSAGTYTVTITDANNCSMVQTAIITANPVLTVSTVGTEVHCNPGADGTATATAQGGTPDYTYTWSNGATGLMVTGLATGTYIVTATDAAGCAATSMVVIDLGQYANLTSTITVDSEVSTNNGSDGALTANPANGSGSYTYLWSNGATTQSISGLTAGTYSVTITDVETGCITTAEVSLTNPVEPTGKIGDKVFFDLNQNGTMDPSEPGVSNVTVTLTGVTNDGETVSLITTTDATGMYLFENLEAGNYKVTFTDLPVDTEFTAQNSSSSDETDSDVNINTGMTEIFPLADGECNLTIDAGIIDACPCDNFTDPGQICCDQTACGAGYDPDPITSLEAPSGGSGGEIEYLWMMKEGTGPFNQSQVVAIPNTNSPTFDPGPLYVTTTYYRCVRRGQCCPFIEGTGVTIFINNDADASFTGPADNILCQGEAYTYTANNINSSATYQWSVEGNAVTTDLDEPSIEVVWSSNGFHDVTLTVTDNSCTANTVDTRLVTNSPDYCGNAIQGLVIDATVVHSGEVMVELISDGTPNTGTEYVLERSKDGVEFSEMDAVPMAATYTQTSDYAPLRGRSFYRVRMTNNIGNISYSNVEEVTIFIGNENTLIYPNPFRGQVSYEIKDTFGEDVSLEIISPDGRIVRTYTTDKDTFQNSLDLSDLPIGVYFMRFNFSSIGVQTYKMTKQ